MTGLPGFAAWGLAGLLVCTALLILRRPVAQLIRLILRSSVGLAALALFSQVGQALGVDLRAGEDKSPSLTQRDDFFHGLFAVFHNACSFFFDFLLRRSR